MDSKKEKLKETRKRAYEKFKESEPDKLNEMRRKASKIYYEKNKDKVRTNCREYARRKREIAKIESGRIDW